MEFDLFLYLAYLLVIVATASAIILPLINSIGNPQSLLKSGIGILAIVALYFISYAFSGSEVTAEYSKYEVGPELSKLMGGALIMAYLMLGIAILGIVFTEFNKILK